MDVPENRERQDLYKKYEEEIFRRELSNSQNYDSAILTYSAAGLGLSLAFIKEIVPIAHLAYLCLLYLSWLCFIAAIVSTIASYQVSQQALRRQLEQAKRYYLDGDDKALNEKNALALLLGRITIGAGAIFVAGVILTAIFVALNLSNEKVRRDMENKYSNQMVQSPATQLVERGAPIPVMQPVSKPAPAASAPASKPSESAAIQPVKSE